MDIVIAGLGNPGVKYAKTLHNVGFMVCDMLASELSLSWKEESRYKAKLAKGTPKGTPKGTLRTNKREEQEEVIIHLLCPLTYMNLSGESIALYLKEKNIPVSRLLVIADDADLPFGQLRMRFTGGSGGQNGLKSIIEALKTSDFKRLRVGIGRPVDLGLPSDMPLSAYVLCEPSVEVLLDLNKAIERASNALLELGNLGFVEVQRKINEEN